MHFATFVAALVAAWHYFCAHLAPIGAALVPMLIASIIAGKTNKPGDADGKAVALLKMAARFCGWARHYDEPGSVKLPASELLVLIGKGALEVYGAVKGKKNMTPLALLLGVSLLAGCPNPGAVAKQIAYDSAACAVGQVPAAVADTVEEAKGSLFGTAGTPTWSDFAKGDLMKFGVNAAICIIEAAIHDIDAAMAGVKGQLSPGYIGAHQLAEDWLAKHNVKHDHAATMRSMRADLRLRQRVLEAMNEIPELPVCDTSTKEGATTCRPIVVDDDMPAALQ